MSALEDVRASYVRRLEELDAQRDSPSPSSATAPRPPDAASRADTGVELCELDAGASGDRVFLSPA